MAESSTITREGDGEVLRRLAALRCHQTCEAARDQDGGKTPCLDCPDPELRPYRDAARDLKAAIPLSGDDTPDDALTTGIKAGLEAAIRGIDATILNVGSECSRRGIQDPETGEVPCEGEEDRGCACSEALELGDRLIKNLRSADVAKIAAAPPGPWRPQLAGADRLGRDRTGDVTINVPTALCWLQFRPDVSTGTEDETRPGVGFTLVAYLGSAGEWPCGVIPRDEAFRLYEMLGRFFAAHPPSGEPAAQELEAAAADAAPVQANRLRRIAAVLRGATVGGPSCG